MLRVVVWACVMLAWLHHLPTFSVCPRRYALGAPLPAIDRLLRRESWETITIKIVLRMLEAELLPAEWPPEEYVDGLLTPTPVGDYGVIPPIDYYALQLGYEIIDDDATLPEGVIDHDRRQKLCPSSHGC